MKLSHYGFSTSLRVRPYGTLFPVNNFDYITACRMTNHNFLVAQVFVHAQHAATINIDKYKNLILFNLYPQPTFLGYCYESRSEKQILANVEWPEKWQSLERFIKLLRYINSPTLASPWKIKIKFDNIVAKWNNEQIKSATA